MKIVVPGMMAMGGGFYNKRYKNSITIEDEIFTIINIKQTINEKYFEILQCVLCDVALRCICIM